MFPSGQQFGDMGVDFAQQRLSGAEFFPEAFAFRRGDALLHDAFAFNGDPLHFQDELAMMSEMQESPAHGH